MKNKARIMLIISMTIFGTLALFVKNINVSSGELALYRAVLAAIFLLFYLLITKQKISFKDIKKDLIIIIISGMAMGFNWIFLFEAYKYTTVSVATLSYYFAPIIVTLVCPIIFKEKLTIKQIICFIASTIGIILITDLSNMSNNSSHLLGIIFGLIAASLYATVIILNKYIKSISGIHRTFIQFLSAIVILIPYVLLTSGITISNLNSNGWINLLIVGIVHTGITYCLYFTSLKELPGQNAAILSYIDPVVAILISVFILNEQMSFIQVMGGILIIVFTLLNELKIQSFKKINGDKE